MKMSPIKKIVIGLAVITVALSLITANNMASVMLIVASREAGSSAQQSVQTNQPVQNQANNSQSSFSNNNTANDNTATNTPETTAPAADNNASDNTANDNAANNDAPADNNASADDKAPADDKGNANADSGKLSDKEVVDLYKKAVNAARTKSTSVVRVKDGAINYKGIVEAGKLSGTASTLMGMFMKSDASAIEAKNEPWEKEKLPDASALTVNGLQKISYEEKDGKYVVTLVAKNASNPKAGADGVGAISGVIEESQITGAIGSVPGLTLDGISIDYENVTSVATIDKATGNLVALNLDAPCVLNIAYAKVPILGEVNNAKVGIEVITEYSIAY